MSWFPPVFLVASGLLGLAWTAFLLFEINKAVELVVQAAASLRRVALRNENRKVTPQRPAHADLRSREYLTGLPCLPRRTCSLALPSSWTCTIRDLRYRSPADRAGAARGSALRPDAHSGLRSRRPHA